MPKINHIVAREIFDSRGNPTIETRVTIDNGARGKSSVPSGSSIGTHEAAELRDGDLSNFNGLGVTKAVDAVNQEITKVITGMDAANQGGIDRAMIDLDGTPNKARLGANSILSVSQAVAAASAISSDMSLAAYIGQIVSNEALSKIPIPIFNLMEGGKHAKSPLDFQEYLVIPASTKTFTESFEIGVRVYQSLKKIITNRGMIPLTADEGGFSPTLGTNKAALSFLREAIEASGITFTIDAFMGLDIAANTIYTDKAYRLIDRPTPLSSLDLANFYQDIFGEYSLIYIEDPFAEEDIDGWKKISTTLGDKTLIVGDDLIATNPFRLEQAIENKLVGGIVIKPNQIGTVSEAIAVAEIAKFKEIKTIVSHRSGETEDTFIADFAVGIGADYVKFGAPARERMIKYNRLLKLASELKISE